MRISVLAVTFLFFPFVELAGFSPFYFQILIYLPFIFYQIFFSLKFHNFHLLHLYLYL